MTKEELYEKLRKRYGCAGQLVKTLEELAELSTAISRFIYKHNAGDMVNISEEIADVEIMLEQVKMMYGLDAPVESWKELKIERQIKRELGDKVQADEG